mmetsp:Transcript_523/g.1583  ORF Transcript_523/g.1583 Transcript_523/m.1583 type:complete len:254 (-) Transcript_523:21-782(-)
MRRMAFPASLAAACQSFGPPPPQVATLQRPPTMLLRTSFRSSLATTQGCPAYRRAKVVCASSHCRCDHRVLYHSPFSSRSPQHQSPSDMWLSRMIMSPASAQAVTTASRIWSVVLPVSSRAADSRRSAWPPMIAGSVSTISTDQGRRTQLKPMSRKVCAMPAAERRWSPPTTPSRSSAPLQLRHASFTRRPSRPTIQRPSVRRGSLWTATGSAGGGTACAPPRAAASTARRPAPHAEEPRHRWLVCAGAKAMS